MRNTGTDRTWRHDLHFHAASNQGDPLLRVSPNDLAERLLDLLCRLHHPLHSADLSLAGTTDEADEGPKLAGDRRRSLLHRARLDFHGVDLGRKPYDANCGRPVQPGLGRRAKGAKAESQPRCSLFQRHLLRPDFRLVPGERNQRRVRLARMHQRALLLHHPRIRLQPLAHPPIRQLNQLKEAVQAQPRANELELGNFRSRVLLLLGRFHLGCLRQRKRL